MTHNRRSKHGIMIFIAFMVISSLSFFSMGNGSEKDSNFQVQDWQKYWEVKDGFSIAVDADGFYLPTSIAMVPNPGSGPKDPLYYVAELAGTIKVVTNDRSVYTFAEGFIETVRGTQLDTVEDEYGLVGVCLEPKHGYVYAAFSYPAASDNILRSGIMRFETQPYRFGLEPVAEKDLSSIFYDYPSGPSHLIGNCQVHDDNLYVAARRPAAIDRQ